LYQGADLWQGQAKLLKVWKEGSQESKLFSEDADGGGIAFGEGFDVLEVG
jgi:hypothetical protein